MSGWVATVGYVRSLGIGALSVWCAGRRLGGYTCNHQTEFDLSPYSDDLALHAIERRLACTHCGAIGEVNARPNWTELHKAGLAPAGRGWIMPPRG